MPHTTITDVRTVGVTVTDQDSALAFYVGQLGFDTRLDAPVSPTMRWVEVAPPGASTSVALTAAKTGGAVGTDTGVRFTVPDARAEHASTQASGVAVGDLVEWDDVPPMYTFDDPDGNRFYIVEESA